MSESARPRAIADRNLAVLLVCRTAARLLLFIPYVFHFMTQVRGLSPLEFGLLHSIYYGAVVVAEVPTGVLADRLGRKASLVAAGLMACGGCVVYALAPDFRTFAAGELLFALAVALGSGADSALLYDSLAEEGREGEYAQAEGRMQGAWLLLSALGLPLADLFLVEGDDPVRAVWASAVVCGLGGVGCLALVEPRRHVSASSREITAGAVRDVWRVPGLLRLVVYAVGLFILLRAAIVILYNPVLGASGVPLRTWGTLLALVNLVGGIAAWRGSALLARLGPRPLLVGLPLALVAMYVVLLTVRVPVVALAFVVQGAVLGLHPVLVRSILNQRLPSASRRATVLSLESLSSRLVYAAIGMGVSAVLGSASLEWAVAAALGAGSVPLAVAAWGLAGPGPDPASRADGMGDAGPPPRTPTRRWNRGRSKADE